MLHVLFPETLYIPLVIPRRPPILSWVIPRVLCLQPFITECLMLSVAFAIAHIFGYFALAVVPHNKNLSRHVCKRLNRVIDRIALKLIRCRYDFCYCVREVSFFAVNSIENAPRLRSLFNLCATSCLAPYRAAHICHVRQCRLPRLDRL